MLNDGMTISQSEIDVQTAKFQLASFLGYPKADINFDLVISLAFPEMSHCRFWLLNCSTRIMMSSCWSISCCSIWVLMTFIWDWAVRMRPRPIPQSMIGICMPSRHRAKRTKPPAVLSPNCTITGNTTIPYKNRPCMILHTNGIFPPILIY